MTLRLGLLVRLGFRRFIPKSELNHKIARLDGSTLILGLVH
jgi:hypothetical protein